MESRTIKSSKSRWNSWAVVGVAAVLAVGSLLGTVRGADDAKGTKPPTAKNPVRAAKTGPDQFKIPDGSAEELQAFLKELFQKEPEDESPAGLVKHKKKVLWTMVGVAEKILAGKPDKDAEETAVHTQLQALWLLQQMDDPAAVEALAKATAQLSSDKRPEISAEAKVAAIGARFFKIKETDTKQISALIDELSKQFAAGDFDGFYMRVGRDIAGELEERDQPKLAMDAYNKFADAIDKQPQLARVVGSFRASADKLALIGKPIEISGLLSTGKKFDWAPYKGKVVLIDFWATWCGPCMEELPNVKQAYAKFHKKGFDIVGVDLDEDKDALSHFLDEEKIPWAIIVGSSKDESGWNHPLVQRYKIEGIPAMFLVDRQGKVVSVNARGEKLGKRVAELLDEK